MNRLNCDKMLHSSPKRRKLHQNVYFNKNDDAESNKTDSKGELDSEFPSKSSEDSHSGTVCFQEEDSFSPSNSNETEDLCKMYSSTTKESTKIDCNTNNNNKDITCCTESTLLSVEHSSHRRRSHSPEAHNNLKVKKQKLRHNVYSNKNKTIKPARTDKEAPKGDSGGFSLDKYKFTKINNHSDGTRDNTLLHNEDTTAKQRSSNEIFSNDSSGLNISLQDNDLLDDIPSMWSQMEDEIQEQLEKKAQKNNLSTAVVKQMLKAVITNEDVLKMVDFNLHKTTEAPRYEPKLTRAKTKILFGSEPAISRKSEIEVLISEDLPEDSSDEEYNPQEDQSDEESKVDEFPTDGCLADETLPEDILADSDEESKADDGLLDENLEGSLHAMVADQIAEENASHDSPLSPSNCEATNKNSNVENIGQRTRSKLSLSETPLEAIEQAFIPPDITTDMYNTDCDNKVWLNFLQEFMQPLDNSAVENLDDENDPEYHVRMDEEQEAATDKEELRADRAVKVSKKEYNELMTELMECTNMLSSDEEDSNDSALNRALLETHSKLESETQESVETKTQPVTAFEDTFNEPFLTLDFSDESSSTLKVVILSKDQSDLLKQQLAQHVQLTLQTYLLTYKYDDLDHVATTSQNLMDHLFDFQASKPPDSFFNINNLGSAIKMMKKWQNIVASSCESPVIPIKRDFRPIKCPKLSPILMEACLTSTAFPFPLYLPRNGFLPTDDVKPSRFSQSEMNLIAIGLESFSMHCKLNVNDDADFKQLCHLLHLYMLPARNEGFIKKHILRQKKSGKPNVIKEFINKGKPFLESQYVFYNGKLRPLLCEPVELFPSNWVATVEGMKIKRKK